MSGGIGDYGIGDFGIGDPVPLPFPYVAVVLSGPSDIAHVWGQDLQLGPTGDLAVVTDDSETQQRIIHRLLTNAGDYIWQLDYGAGLPAMVGQVVNGPAIAAIVRAQLLLEDSVAASPEPVVTVQATLDGTVTLSIIYADAATGATQILSLPVG